MKSDDRLTCPLLRGTPWLLAALSCSAPDTTLLSPPAEALPVADVFAPLGEPLPDASAARRESFERGREVFKRRFTPEMGLGPLFNVTSCGACHERPVPGGSAGRYRNFILQGQSLPDGSFVATGVKGVQDHYSREGLARHPDDEQTNRRALRNPIPFFGVGLLAALDDEEIARRADPDDLDGDGISGRVNYDRGFVGRFGRKSQTVSIEGFIRGPLFNHAGITTDPLSDELLARLPVPSARGQSPRPESAAGFAPPAGPLGRLRLAQAAAPDEPTFDEDGVPDPEMPAQDLFDLVSFAMLLAPPAPDPPSAESEAGAELFGQIGCDGCHVPALASERGRLPVYSDLLLHDMGPELADGIVMKEASGSEFRTQPLWGIAAVGPYLHDGSADTLAEAIARHGGEAATSRDSYLALSSSERDRIVTFLRSLGGAASQSPGLLPPDDPLPEVGTLGGPQRRLTGGDRLLFERGRLAFDRDVLLSEGLGLSGGFNGDSCRACHFEPVMGGAGPSDVDVTRQAIILADGSYAEPPDGTMVHHQGVEPRRPAPDPSCNYFELRQTPPLFGLGLLERVSDETLLSLADPDDADGDGISGVAQVLSDGRIGRLGWKAEVPTLAEFARDASTNELGLTLPPQPGLRFGRERDEDATADPEQTVEQLEALTYFMQQLAPPERASTDPEAERAGEQVFGEVGCAACHVPELPTRTGGIARAFTDLLLHEVLPEGAPGIVVGAAGERSFRTPPLWGLSDTAPYMHDGRASTIEAAIAAHDGEARASVQRLRAAGAPDREALLSFLRSL